MRQFTVYETDTGNILKVLTQSKDPVLKEGQSFIEGNYPDDQFDIVDGQPVENVKDTARIPPTEEKELQDQQTPEGEDRSPQEHIHIRGQNRGHMEELPKDREPITAQVHLRVHLDERGYERGRGLLYIDRKHLPEETGGGMNGSRSGRTR